MIRFCVFVCASTGCSLLFSFLLLCSFRFVRVALKLRSLCIRPPRLSRYAVFLIQTNVLSRARVQRTCAGRGHDYHRFHALPLLRSNASPPDSFKESKQISNRPLYFFARMHPPPDSCEESKQISYRPLHCVRCLIFDLRQMQINCTSTLPRHELPLLPCAPGRLEPVPEERERK